MSKYCRIYQAQFNHAYFSDYIDVPAYYVDEAGQLVDIAKRASTPPVVMDTPKTLIPKTLKKPQILEDLPDLEGKNPFQKAWAVANSKAGRPAMYAGLGSIALAGASLYGVHRLTRHWREQSNKKQQRGK